MSDPELPFEEVQHHPSWMTRESAVRFFGLTNDDEGWDELNEIVEEFEIDCELGAAGDVLRIDGNDPGVREALLGRHERQTGVRPDDPKAVAKARKDMIAERKAERAARLKERKARLGKRIAARKKTKKRRVEE